MKEDFKTAYNIICIVFFSFLLFILLDNDTRNSILYATGVKPFNQTIFWNFFSGTGTIAAIAITYSLFTKRQREKEIAQINSIIDEIYHNTVVGGIFTEGTSEEEVKMIISELNNLTDIEKYPNPDDKKDGPFEHGLFSIFKNFDPKDRKKFLPKNAPRENIFPLKDSAISLALSTGTAVILSKRIYLNLSHLHYSIKRLNILIEDWNIRKKSSLSDETLFSLYGRIKGEYFIWLHFRLLFSLIDILRSYPPQKIYNQNLYRHYRRLARSEW